MEFLNKNLLNTTTQLSVNSNTLTQANVFNYDLRRQYFSDGFANDLTTTTITIAFDETTSVSRIAMMEHNIKEYNIFYDGVTANTFSFTTTSNTTTSQFTSNSETSSYYFANTQDCTSVTFDLKGTQTADVEKAIGLIVLGNVLLDFERIPAAKNYKPLIEPKEIVHKLSDGGTRTHFVQDKNSAKIKYKFISETFRNSLKTVYDRHDAMIFVPFGTATGWDKILYECVWTGKFDFFKFSDNAVGAGFSGQIMLKETS